MLTKNNHLYSALLAQPAQKASNFLVQLLAFYRGNTMETFLSKFPIKEFEDDSEYYWDVVGSNKRNIPLIEARKIDGTIVENNDEMIGAGVEPFYLVFGEDWFAHGEIIFGNLNEVYQFRILGEPRNEGTNTVYKVELVAGNTEGVPAERLQAGERFSVGFAAVSKELSRKAGDIRFNTPVSMRNEWTTIRLQHKAPGSMLNKKIIVGVPMTQDAPNGYKTTKMAHMWMHHVEWTFEQQWQDYKNMAIAWGRSNRNANGEYLNFEENGEVIRMGNGLFAQMEQGGNTRYYNTFSLKMLEDALYDICANTLDFQNRTFVLRTGQRGAALFNKAVRDTVSGWTNFSIDGTAVGVVKKTSSPLHSNALAAGYQFTEYLGPNGLHLKLEVDPFYDDPVQNKVQHYLGGPAMSYRFDILDIGNMNQPNIFLCKIKGQGEVRGFQPGLRNPFTGEMDINYMSHDEDSAIMHRMTSLGVCILDPTRTMSLIPAVLHG